MLSEGADDFRPAALCGPVADEPVEKSVKWGVKKPPWFLGQLFSHDYGLRPIPEIQFADYILPAFDQLVSEAPRLRYRSGGEFWAPITVRSPYGGGIFGGQTHSQSPEAIFAHITGLKTVIPSTPYDAKGLLIAAIEDDDPVIFLEPKRLYNGPFDGRHDQCWRMPKSISCN